ncbi:MAG: hypothetical protein ACRD4I_07215 [Candidatus Angelobacter sp.]
MNLVYHCPDCLKTTGKVIHYASQQAECAVCGCRQLEPLPPVGHHDDLPTIEQIMADPAGSSWIKRALGGALSRDPVDAANDADVLAQLLDRRCRQFLNHS